MQPLLQKSMFCPSSLNAAFRSPVRKKGVLVSAEMCVKESKVELNDAAALFKCSPVVDTILRALGV